MPSNGKRSLRLEAQLLNFVWYLVSMLKNGGATAKLRLVSSIYARERVDSGGCCTPFPSTPAMRANLHDSSGYRCPKTRQEIVRLAALDYKVALSPSAATAPPALAHFCAMILNVSFWGLPGFSALMSLICSLTNS